MNKPISIQDKFASDRLAVFQNKKPDDISDIQWEHAKKHAAATGTKLPKEVEQSCFYYFLMDDSWDDISSKLNIPLGILVYTALSYRWHNRKEALQNIKPGTKIGKADAAAVDLVTDTIVATAAVYKSRLAEVITDPSKADSCALIPKNIKELQALMMLFQSLNPENRKVAPSAPSVNVNIANLPGSATSVSPARISAAQDAEVVDGEEEIDPRVRLEVLKLLERVKAQ